MTNFFAPTSMSSSQNQGSSSQDSADYLRSATFSKGSGAISSDDNTLTASDLLAGGFDPTRLHPLAGLKDQLEYLQLEDDKVSDLPGGATALPSRGWSDDLCYGTGTTYLSGMSSATLELRLVGHSLSLAWSNNCLIVLVPSLLSFPL